MSFDANQAVQETIVHLEDELKGLNEQRAAAVSDFDTKINAVQEQLDGWVNLLGRGASGTDQRDVVKTGAAKPVQEGDEITSSKSEAGQSLETNGSKPAAKKAAAKRS